MTDFQYDTVLSTLGAKGVGPPQRLPGAVSSCNRW